MNTQMGRLLKAGHSIDVRHLQQLAQRRRWSFVIAAAGAASLAVGAQMGALGMLNINAAIASRSAAEPGVLQLAYRKCVFTFITITCILLAQLQCTATAGFSDAFNVYTFQEAFFGKENTALYTDCTVSDGVYSSGKWMVGMLCASVLVIVREMSLKRSLHPLVTSLTQAGILMLLLS
jgi:hypothetical protein